MRTLVWRVTWISSVVVAVFSVLLPIVAGRTGAADCAAVVCDPNGYATIFYIAVGVVLTGLSLATYGFSRARREAGPAVGLLTSILILGFVAGGAEDLPAWLTALTWIVGGWFLIVSVAGLALLRGHHPPHAD
ncbi:hypothetical protein [Streptomyces sp. SID13031]|uniref:hypothetical protein n=1 Tax=Streptomyces sp. SID13031 TaxID=2706046 RepID=UPI0013CC65E7|nr:hypothetical protein [Streptomyces sp. SID13031]NEA31717.1 hypothetical protein [Streptomyces sp. SID13031]